VVRILVAEDEERIARFIEKGLRAAGYAPTVVADGVTAVDYASSGQYDLLLLDVGLPRLDGFMVLSVLRRDHLNIPVIFLTARDSAADTVAGLEGGADDYMAKPFRFEELVARIRLRLRPSDGNEALAGNTMRSGSLELNLHTHTLRVGGEKTVELSAREFALVEMFLHHPGQILSRQQLLSHVWGYDFDSTSNIVDVYVSQLRQKIGAERIITARGAGYRLATP
jgi:DNA-binding response OmpR family regulator